MDEPKKDLLSEQFGIVGAPSTLEASAQWESFHAALKARVVQMLGSEFEKLQSILYLMDVDEDKASRAFAIRDRDESAAQLATLMMNRHVARMRTRQQRSEEFDLE